MTCDGDSCGFILVPMALGVLIESREHDGKDLSCIVTDKTHYIFVVPVIQCPFSNLKHQVINSVSTTCRLEKQVKTQCWFMCFVFLLLYCYCCNTVISKRRLECRGVRGLICSVIFILAIFVILQWLRIQQFLISNLCSISL